MENAEGGYGWLGQGSVYLHRAKDIAFTSRRRPGIVTLGGRPGWLPAQRITFTLATVIMVGVATCNVAVFQLRMAVRTSVDEVFSIVRHLCDKRPDTDDK